MENKVPAFTSTMQYSTKGLSIAIREEKEEIFPLFSTVKCYRFIHTGFAQFFVIYSSIIRFLLI